MAEEFKVGTVVDERYEILDLLGIGGMGRVFKAMQVNLDRVVAIKVPSSNVLKNPEFMARFVREGRTCAKVSHGHIVAIYDVHSGERPYIVMEYVHGRPLNHFLREESTTLFVSDLLDILHQICMGLDAAHRAGIVHRDIKPANIVITHDSQRVKIMDFGIARVEDASSVTSTGSIMGTPYYMAPEQIKGEKVSGATDLYALACIVYKLFTGHLVFRGEVANLIYHHVSTAPTPPVTVNPMLPRTLDAVLLRALAKKPGERYSNAENFYNELRKALRPLHSIPYSQVFQQVDGEGHDLPDSMRVGETDETQTLPPRPAAGPAPAYVSLGSGEQVGEAKPSGSGKDGPAPAAPEETRRITPTVPTRAPARRKDEKPDAKPEAEQAPAKAPPKAVPQKAAAASPAARRLRWPWVMALVLLFGACLLLGLGLVFFSDRSISLQIERIPSRTTGLRADAGGGAHGAEDAASIPLVGAAPNALYHAGQDLLLLWQRPDQAEAPRPLYRLTLVEERSGNSEAWLSRHRRFVRRLERPGDYVLTLALEGDTDAAPVRSEYRFKVVE